MNLSYFIGANPEIASEIKISQKLKVKDTNRRKPKRFFALIIILLVIAVGTKYVIDSLIEPEPIVVPSNEKQLQGLVDKVLKGVPLPTADWNDLCRLLSIVKGIDINSCNECQNYIKALLGGKHANWLQKYLKLEDKNILKGIKSINKQIADHLDKIKNPLSHYPNWNNLDKRHQEDLVNNKWNKDIKRQREQKEILECILKNR